MNGIILSFRRGIHNQKPNQILIEAEGFDSKEKSVKLVGRKVVWTSPAGKKLVGTVTSLHGNSGVVKARFSKGLPGQALGKGIRFLEAPKA